MTATGAEPDILAALAAEEAHQKRDATKAVWDLAGKVAKGEKVKPADSVRAIREAGMDADGFAALVAVKKDRIWRAESAGQFGALTARAKEQTEAIEAHDRETQAISSQRAADRAALVAALRVTEGEVYGAECSRRELCKTAPPDLLAERAALQAEMEATRAALVDAESGITRATANLWNARFAADRLRDQPPPSFYHGEDADRAQRSRDAILTAVTDAEQALADARANLVEIQLREHELIEAGKELTERMMSP